MSYNVLVIPEDFTKDEHILLPLIRRVLGDAGKPNAAVLVCRDPNFQGIGGALDYQRIKDEVVLRYPMVDLFVLFVDNDAKPGREDSVTGLVGRIQSDLRANQGFLGVVARQEVEIFPIAGHALPQDWSWQAVRMDGDVKNTYFLRLAQREGTLHLPHQGRKILMTEAMRNWNRIKSRCPEETTGLVQEFERLQ